MLDYFAIMIIYSCSFFLQVVKLFMTDIISMSKVHNLNIISTEKIKPSKVSKNVDRIAEFKKRATLKFCNENGTKICEYYEKFNSICPNEKSMCYCYVYFYLLKFNFFTLGESLIVY